MQKAPMKRICRHCASQELAKDEKGEYCLSCGKHATPLEMNFAQVIEYKKELKAREDLHHFSWKRCDELQALWLIMTAVTILLVFMWLSS